MQFSILLIAQQSVTNKILCRELYLKYGFKLPFFSFIKGFHM